MKCKDFEDMIHELAGRRAAKPAKHIEALEHAGQCLWCARRLDEESKLTERLQAFASTLQGQRAPLRVETELLQAFREKNLRAGAPLSGRAWARIWRRVIWGLAFAATVAAAWIVLVQWPGHHRLPGGVPFRAAISRPPVDSGASRSDVARGHGTAGAAAEHIATPQVGHAGNPQTSTLGESSNELATDFISLGTCDDSQCMEEATLVRVALPAEAMMAFGLGAENEYAPDALVQADVALASNGVPFAIRFVD